MTSTAPTTELDPASPGDPPFRHGMPWTEEDFAGIMQASKEGCGLEEIAARIGRSVHGLRPQALMIGARSAATDFAASQPPPRQAV